MTLFVTCQCYSVLFNYKCLLLVLFWIQWNTNVCFCAVLETILVSVRNEEGKSWVQNKSRRWWNQVQARVRTGGGIWVPVWSPHGSSTSVSDLAPFHETIRLRRQWKKCLGVYRSSSLVFLWGFLRTQRSCISLSDICVCISTLRLFWHVVCYCMAKNRLHIHCIRLCISNLR